MPIWVEQCKGESDRENGLPVGSSPVVVRAKRVWVVCCGKFVGEHCGVVVVATGPE